MYPLFRKILMDNWKRTFAIIWSGQFFSTLTSSVVGYAVVFWLSLQTQSATVLAYAMIASLLPQIVLGLFSGVFVDRWNRKLTMICADTFIATCTAVLGLMFYLDTVNVWQIYVLLALRSAGSAFHTPAMQSSIPLLAPESELMRISGVNQMIYSISSIAGPAIAALLINLVEMTYVMMLDVVGAAIACISLLFVAIPNPKKEGVDQEKDILKEIKMGLSALFSQRGLAWLFLCEVSVMFFILPISALFPLFTIKYFLGGSYEMSAVEIAWGIGMLLGGALLGINLMKQFNKVVLIAITCIIVGLTFLLSGLLPTNGFIFFAILTGIGGVAVAIWSGSFTVILQTKVDQAMLGRAFAIYDSLTLMPSIPGLLATGFIAEMIGLTNAFIYSGIIVCLVGLVIFFIPSTIELGKSTIGVSADPEK